MFPKTCTTCKAFSAQQKTSHGAPLTVEEWTRLLESTEYDQNLHRTIVQTRLDFMVKDSTFYHYADKEFFETRDEVIFLSDLHADPCRFLVLLYKNNLIEFGDDFKKRVEARTGGKAITDLFYESLRKPESGAELLDKLQWVPSDQKSARAVLVLGDLVDGKRLGDPYPREREVPTLGAISNEYFLHVLMVHLRLLASRADDYIFFCLGNHEILRISNDNRYLASRDKDYLQIGKGKTSLELLECFYHSSPHLFFLFPKVKNKAGASGQEDTVYAAHAELFRPTDSMEVLQKNLRAMEYLEEGVKEKGLLAHLISPIARQTLQRVGSKAMKGPLWNRNFFFEYEKGKKGITEAQIRKWRSNTGKIQHFVAGHTVIGEEVMESSSNAVHHYHESPHLKDFYFFVDKGLSRCFDRYVPGADPYFALKNMQLEYPIDVRQGQVSKETATSLETLRAENLGKWKKELAAASSDSQLNELNIDWSLLRLRRNGLDTGFFFG